MIHGVGRARFGVGRGSRRGEGGFTLIEMMVALVVGGIVMSALVSFIVLALRQAPAVQNRAVETRGFAVLNNTLQRDVANAARIYIKSSTADSRTACGAIPSSAIPPGGVVDDTAGASIAFRSKTDVDYPDAAVTITRYTAVRVTSGSKVSYSLLRVQCPSGTTTQAVTSTSTLVTSASTNFLFECAPLAGGTATTPCRTDLRSGAGTTKDVEVRLSFAGASKKRVTFTGDTQVGSTAPLFFDLDCSDPAVNDPNAPRGFHLDELAVNSVSTTQSRLGSQLLRCPTSTTNRSTKIVVTLKPNSGTANLFAPVPTGYSSFAWVIRDPGGNDRMYRCNSAEVPACPGVFALPTDPNVTKSDFDPGDTTTAADNPTTPTAGIVLPASVVGAVGNYEVTLVATATDGRVLSGSMSFNVASNPPTAPQISTVSGTYAAAVPACTPTCGAAFDFQGLNFSDPDGSIVSGTWDWGDGTTSPAPVSCGGSPVSCSSNLSHGYFASGTYLVTLTVNDNEGGSATSNVVTITITGNDAPTLTMAADDTTPSGSTQLVNFSSTAIDSDGTIVSGTWTFGDGSPTANFNPTCVAATPPSTPPTTCTATVAHAYAQGNFTARLTVTDDKGASVTQTVDIISGNQAPVAVIVPPIQTGPAPFLATFTHASTDAEGPITATMWTFGDVPSGGLNTSTLAAPSHNYTTPGEYEVTLIVFDQGSPPLPSAEVKAKVIVTNQAPVARATATPLKVRRYTQATSQTDSPGLVTFNASASSDPNSGQTLYFNWDFGDSNASPTFPNTATGPSPTHTYTSPGTYIPRVVVDDGFGGVDSMTLGPIVVGADDDKDGWFVDSIGGVFQAVDCNDGDAGVNPAAADPLGGGDTNCDGQDGVAFDTIYVRGIGTTGTPAYPIGADSAGCGAITSPCRQISTAISRARDAGAHFVLAGIGTYSAFSIDGGALTVRGNYSQDFKSNVSMALGSVAATACPTSVGSTTRTCIDGGTIGGRSAAIAITDTPASRPVVIENMEVRGQDLATAGVNGETSYGVYIARSQGPGLGPLASPNVTLSNMNIRGGKGGKGQNGLPGVSAPSTQAPSGAVGDPAIQANGIFDSSHRQAGGGTGAIAFGAQGGLGGPGGSITDAGFTGNAQPGVAGALGGPGSSTPPADVVPTYGTAGAAGAAETCSGYAWYEFIQQGICMALGDGRSASPGGNGGAGTSGPATSGGVKGTSSVGTVGLDDWAPVASMNGADGGRGLHGSPGGGGGGGGGSNAGEPDGFGGGGGGGGAGASRATTPGGGGRTGGASIAVFVVDSNPSLTNLQITLGNGGLGGLGANGAAGQLGGFGGAGGARESGTGGAGGAGGNGGNGSNSGPGGGGAGGPSVGLFTARSTKFGTPAFTPTTGQGGNGSNGGARLYDNLSAGGKGDNGVRQNEVTIP